MVFASPWFARRDEEQNSAYSASDRAFFYGWQLATGNWQLATATATATATAWLCLIIDAERMCVMKTRAFGKTGFDASDVELGRRCGDVL